MLSSVAVELTAVPPILSLPAPILTSCVEKLIAPSETAITPSVSSCFMVIFLVPSVLSAANTLPFPAAIAALS